MALTKKVNLAGVVVVSEKNVTIEGNYDLGSMPKTITGRYMVGTHEEYKVECTLNTENDTANGTFSNATLAPATIASFQTAIIAKLREIRDEIAPTVVEVPA